ncbi:S8 family serine peptidase [Pseudomonas sp. xss_2]|uniref:S8 family serine peptidase n=1 Tax=Pseudomonas sp. xss_2 TaxID=3367215 RepID=UPI003709F6C8
MSLDVRFVYYRNFRFDGQFHVRCTGADLDKIRSIRYVLEKTGPDGRPVQLDSKSVYSQAQSGQLVDHGCPATLRSEPAVGTFTIKPTISLRAAGQSPQVWEPLAIVVNHGELSRGILDDVPLAGVNSRRRRSVGAESVIDSAGHIPLPNDPYGQSLEPFAEVAPGKAYPTLIIKFVEGGWAQFVAELEPGSGSQLVRLWPKLKEVISLQPFLAPLERDEEKVQALRNFYYLEQPASMLNDTYTALLKTLAALEYVEVLEFVPADSAPGNVLLGAAAVVATLITGAAVVAGNQAYDDAQPTPDFESQQTYLDEPGPRYRGMNIRKAWAQQVTGNGARVHFSDAGLFPNHEDLRGNSNLKIVSLLPNGNPSHGTQSVGILLATANGVGMTGICHGAELYLYNNFAKDQYGRIRTPKDLLRHVEPGDIVTINRQSAHGDVLWTFLPSIHERAWWEATKALTERGAVVIFAAANGSTKTNASKGTTANYGVDLSQWRFFNDYGEADAILIGACQSWDGKPHQYSNYAYRGRMLNSWGDSVATLSGGGELQNKSAPDRVYTDNYGGTSSATPLVAGALSLIQSYAIEQHHIYLNADQMHLLVMATGYLDATLPHSQVLPMGRRPNVHAALQLLDRIVGGGRFLAPKDEL